tara:strand:- start:882 stop:2204 length:1323 start_codon:yes stop_codon:yes gene_type:complete
MIQALQLLLSLSILVVLHEFGHYITAKMFGCRVEKFYLFMDWKFAIFKRKIGETEFGLGWLPLGGYVKISGFVDESMDDSGLDTPPEPWELRAKPAWQRLVVMLGGVVVNILLAWFIYSMILFSWGETYMPIKALDSGFSFNEGGEMLGFVDGDILISIDGAELIEYDPMNIASAILFEGAKDVQLIRSGKNMSLEIDPSSVNRVINNIGSFSGNLIEPNIKWFVGGFVPGSLGEKYGLKTGDQITLVNKMQTPFYNNEIREYLQSQANKTVLLTILRNGYVKELSIPLSEDGFLGVIPSTEKYEKTRSFSFLQSFPAGFIKTKKMTNMYWGQVKTIFNPKTGGYKHVGGVISIGKMFPGEWNWFVFWSMTALLSIILAIMNLLPIPALDGGHALIALGEMLTGKKLPIKILMPLQIAGMIMLFALLIYANGMDVIRLFN